MEAALLCQLGDVHSAGEVLTARPTASTADSTRALARLNLLTGDVAAAEQMLAPFPDDGDTIRGHVEGAILRSRIAAPQDRATALSLLDGALLAAAPLRMRRPFLSSCLAHLTGGQMGTSSRGASCGGDQRQRPRTRQRDRSPTRPSRRRSTLFTSTALNAAARGGNQPPSRSSRTWWEIRFCGWPTRVTSPRTR